MIVRKLKQVRNSDHNIKTNGWESARMLLRNDGMGFSFHVTTLYAGAELKMHYRHHFEAVLVLKGLGTIENLATGEVHRLAPGVMYALNANDRHVVRCKTEIVTACVFNPPLTGREVHDETGAYPAEPHALAAAGA